MHSCVKHVWGTTAVWHEAQRALEEFTRRELLDGQAEAHRRLKRILQTGTGG